MSNLFLGLDCSTQSLTAVIIDYDAGKILYKFKIKFDTDLPQYHTKNGVITFEDEKVVHSYPLMWVEALELLFNRFIQESVPIEKSKLYLVQLNNMVQFI